MAIFSRRITCAVLLLTSLASAPRLAAEPGGIAVEGAWTRATPPGADVAVGYVTLVNHGSAPDRLTGGSLEAAGGFELHTMAIKGGIMTMRPLGTLEIPAGASVALEPAGRHIMFTGLKRGLKKGETVAGTLTFEHAGTLPVRFAVEGIGAKTHGAGAEHKGGAMPGMTMD